MNGNPADRHSFPEAPVGAVVDRRYKIRREVARGGVGSVFEADHVVTSARVALKMLRPPAVANGTAEARLLREGRILGSLRHPGVIAVHDAGICPQHGPFLALEMIEGRPLDGLLLARRQLPIDQAVAIAVSLCHTLAYVHRHRIVHRDVKPSNVLIAHTPIGDRLELIDFGIARVGDDAEADDGVKLTRSGELLGTVEYMAPEQLMETSDADERADLYATAVVLYECLTGRVPFSGAPTAVLGNFISGVQVRPIREVRPEVPPELDQVVRRGLAVERNDRYRTCDEFAAACVAALGRPVPAIDVLGKGDEGLDPAALLKRRTEAPTVAETRAPGRRFVRAPYVTPVRIVLESGPVDGRCEDISEGGVLVVVDAACEANQDVEVRLPLPGSGRVARLRAVTRWVSGGRGNRAIGLEFQDPPSDVVDAIRVYARLMSVERPTRH